MKSFTFGYSVRHVSRRVSAVSCDFITQRALYVRQEEHLEVSREGVKGTLKSPPTTSVPDWKAVS